MISPPARRCSPASVRAYSLWLGGTLARAAFPRAGHFLFPSRTSLGASCGVLLTRNARSARGRGLHCVAANRADCTRDGQGASTGQTNGRSLPPSSIPFHDAPHHFGGNNSNRHHASGGACGAAGHVLRKALPRLLPSLQIDDFTQRGGSFCSLTSIGEPNRRSFHGVGKIIHDSTG
jgi:hypothetical protein